MTTIAIRLTAAFLATGLALGACTRSQTTTPAAASAATGAETGAAAIDRARLLAGANEPGQWLTTGGDWRGSHYSRLADLTPQNVAQLGFAWAYSTDTQRGLEATPIVVDGVMYTSGVAGRVYALDAATGKQHWYFDPKVDLQVTRSTCCDQVNRGVAVWQGRVYVAALDGQLYALNAADGQVLWQVDTIVDHRRGYSSTGAPQVAGEVVVIGNGGAEYDARGYISAYDLTSGALRWRFYTVPGDPAQPREHPELELAARTWDTKSAWNYGGGGTVWDGLSYDPELDLLYVPTSNSATYPQKIRSPTGGDNLYVCSMLAISPKTGKLVWHYQETPGDQWDLGSSSPLILMDREIAGHQRKLLVHAPKNGMFYVLDRTSGELLSAKAFAQVNWNHGVDPKTGRPLMNAAAVDYSTGAKLIFPSVVGAHSWQKLAYSEATGLVYIPTTEAGNLLFDNSADHPYRPGLFGANVEVVFAGFYSFLKGAYTPQRRAEMDAALKRNKLDLRMRAYLQAWDPLTQQQVWRSEDRNWWDHAGAFATAGGLVMQGSTDGALQIYDAANGKLLRRIATGSSIIAAPMSYQVNGETYIAVMAAWGGGGWAVPHAEDASYKYGNRGRIIAFKLGGGAVPLPPVLVADTPVPAPPVQTADPATIARGARLFGANCGICHPNMTRSLSADLRRMSAATHQVFDTIVLDGAYKAKGMPAWGDVLTKDDSAAIHAFLIGIQQQAYDAEQLANRAGTKPVAETGVIKSF